MFHRDFSADEAQAIMTSISSSSSSSSGQATGEQTTGDQSADSISRALRSISIEDLANRQDNDGGANHTVDGDGENDPCESDDLASESSGNGSQPSTVYTSDEAESGKDDRMETEDLPPSGDDKMKSEKASKDEKEDGDSLEPVANQNLDRDQATVSQTDQNQTSQNGSNNDVIIPDDQEMDASGFANFSIAELTAVGEIEKPALLTEFQTSMYWLNLRLG